jgi:hypothetical protein
VLGGAGFSGEINGFYCALKLKTLLKKRRENVSRF